QSLQTSGRTRRPRPGVAAGWLEAMDGRSSVVVMRLIPAPRSAVSARAQKEEAPGAKKTLGTRGFLAFVLRGCNRPQMTTSFGCQSHNTRSVLEAQGRGPGRLAPGAAVTATLAGRASGCCGGY